LAFGAGDSHVRQRRNDRRAEQKGEIVMKLLAGLTTGLFIFTGVVHAENEVIYNANSGSLHIPKVAVGSTYYQVEMQQTNRLNFSVTNATPITSSENVK